MLKSLYVKFLRARARFHARQAERLFGRPGMVERELDHALTAARLNCRARGWL